MENEFTTKQFNGEIAEETLDVASLGSELKLIHNKKLLWNHDLANKYLVMTNCPWERNLRDRQVIFIADQMKKGMFRTEITKLASCYCIETNTEYRINGQHVNWARLEVSESDYVPEQIECLKYEAKTIADVRRLYASFDRGSPRTKGDVIKSYLIGTEQFEDTPPTLVRALAEGLAFWQWESNHERQRHTGDDVAFLLQTDYKETVRKIVSFCEEQPKLLSIDFMRKSAVMAAMFETFSLVQKPSEEFWYAIKVGAGLSADDARLKLRNLLMTTNAQKSVASSDKKVVSSEHIYRNIITAWNAWRNGEAVKILRITKKRVRAK